MAQKQNRLTGAGAAPGRGFFSRLAANRWLRSPAFLIFCALALIAWLFFVHPDIIETANHSYLLLDSLFSGRFLHFYEDVAAHQNTLYYINHAHYNIVIYLIFALFELPLYLVQLLSGGAPNEVAIYLMGKLVSGGFFIACVPLVARIAARLGLSEKSQIATGLFFALWPPAFFSALVMGQYDALCLFFTLAGVICWMDGRMTAFSLLFGVGAACKFFPLFIFLPLLLLREKRFLHMLKYLALSFWLLLPTTLLFWGRTGNALAFNNIMLGRLVAVIFPAAKDTALFPLFYLLLLLVAWLWKLPPEKQRPAGIWLSLAAFGLFFLLVEWHPQWLILLGPFVVLSTAIAPKNQRPAWHLLDLILAAAFFLFCAFGYPHALEANLLDFGLVGVLTGLRTTNEAFAGYNPIQFYYSLVPLMSVAYMPVIAGCLLAALVLKVPQFGAPLPATDRGGGRLNNLAGRLLKDGQLGGKIPTAVWLWGVFGLGMACWLLPTLFTWLKCVGFL